MKNKKRDNIILISLGIVIVFLIGAIIYIKIARDGGFDFFKKDISGETYTSSGNLDEKQREAINKKLKSLYNPLYYILDVKNNAEIQYDEDYLESAANQYHMVWQTMLSDKSLDKTFVKGINVFNEKEKGCANIEEKYFDQYYRSILGKNLNKEIFLSDEIEYGITILDGVYYGEEEDIDEKLFVLKSDNLIIDDGSGEYTLNALLLSSINETNKNYSAKAIKKYFKDSVLTWPKELITANVDIIYTQNGEEYNIKSILFSEYYEEVEE